MIDSYLRYPHRRGDLVTFVAENDVWLVSATGGRAWRVCADGVPVSHPKLSPDASKLAWVSHKDGQPEVHVADVAGGLGRRLTYWGDERTVLLGWRDADTVLVASTAGAVSIRRSWAYLVPVDGGPVRRLPYGPVGGLAFADGGAVLLNSVQMREPAAWKRYRGGTAGKLWLDPDGSGEFHRVLSEVDGNLCCPMWLGERIGFCSDHEGVGSVYSCLPDGTELRRHTGGEFYARNAEGDGDGVVYQQAGRIYLLDDLDGEPAELPVTLGGPRGARQPYPIDAAEHLSSFAIDATGTASAVEVRGTVHWLTHADGPARALRSTPGVRARLPVVLGQTGQVAVVTDATGDDALEVLPTDGLAPGATPRRIAEGALGRVLDLVASPDGSQLAVVSHDGRLLLVSVDSGAVREVARAESAEITSPEFSPDSRWLAWAHPGPEPLSQIKLCSVAELSTVDVTELRFVDTEPVFTTDGRYLALLSERTFDPVYDAHVFDVFFPAAARPYLVPLAAHTLPPYAPRPAGRPVSQQKSEDDAEGSAPPETTVEIEGIAERITPLPVAAGECYALRAVHGGLMWLHEEPSGRLGDALPADAVPDQPTLQKLDFIKRKPEKFLSDVDSYDVSADGKRLVVRDGDTLRALSAESKPADEDTDRPDDVRIDLSRVRVSIDPAAEWDQSYDEAGRLMRDNFWRPDMGGVDWSGVLEQYRPLLAGAGSHDDLVDLLWEVQGELGTSHAYVFPRQDGQEQTRALGLLGADVEPDADGIWRVRRVLPSDTSLPDARSPLAAAGVSVRVGDALLAVDGHPVQPRTGPAPLLVGAAGKPVELLVGPADGGEPRRVVVVPLADDKPLRYQEWVADRRAHVHRLSEGRVGYLHVPDMVASGWAQFHRDLRTEVRYPALVADLRENRGGHLSQLVVEKLARTVIGWQVGREHSVVVSYPEDAPRGPVVAVANEFSGSDGDIGNAAIKALGVGPVVGTRTWGGTVGIDQRYRLVDGTLVTQPKYATWMRGQDWGLENHGVDPDVEVVMTPQDWGNGADPQLDAAVRIALQRLAEHPASTVPGYPPLGAR